MPKELLKSFPCLSVDKLNFEEFVDLLIQAPNHPALIQLTKIEKKTFVDPQKSHQLRQFIIDETIKTHQMYYATYGESPNLYKYPFELPINISDVFFHTIDEIKDLNLYHLFGSTFEGHPRFEMNEFESKNSSRMDLLGICVELYLNGKIDRKELDECVDSLRLMCYNSNNQYDIETILRFDLIHQLSVVVN